MRSFLTYEDLQGLRLLATDAILGTTNVSEALHQTIAGTASPRKTPIPPIGGINRIVYKGVRNITKVASVGTSGLFRAMKLLPWDHHESRKRANFLAVINGICGDHLERTQNPLALPMSFRMPDGELLGSGPLPLPQTKPNKLLIMVHGLCMSDLRWSRQGHNHGQKLAEERQWPILYLNYNSGRHISKNGHEFANLLEKLLEGTPSPPDLNIICHSMGGLVLRSACNYAKNHNLSWIRSVERIVFIGSPHHGAPLEGLGQWADSLLTKSPFSAPFERLTSIRSDGINDLRFGSLVDADWAKRVPGKTSNLPRHIPLPEKIACYSIAGTLANASEKTHNRILGDGLVPLNSALGLHPDRTRCLDFMATRIIQDTSHLRLLESQKVYNQLEQWLT